MRTAKYIPADIAETIRYCRLIFPQATFAPKNAHRSKSTMIPYPILFCGIISISTSFASTADKTRVPAKAQIPPARSPDGMEAARPVGLWFMTIPLSPFGTCYSGKGKKFPGQENLSRVKRHMKDDYTSRFGAALRCSWASVTVRNFILVSRTSFSAWVMVSSV